MGATGPWAHNVADLVNRPGARREVHVAAPMGGLVVIASRVPADAPVGLDGVLEWTVEGVLARGRVTAPWQAECRRCLRPVEGAVELTVEELFERRPVEPDSFALAGDQVDLEPLVREAILLELPLAPLCAEACLGICPVCGADRNEGACTCAPGDRDPRWAALDVLRGEGAGEGEGAS